MIMMMLQWWWRWTISETRNPTIANNSVPVISPDLAALLLSPLVFLLYLLSPKFSSFSFYFSSLFSSSSPFFKIHPHFPFPLAHFRLRQKSWSPSSVSCVAARKIVRRSCLGARPRYNLVVDEDVKKPNKQTNLAHLHTFF